MKKSDATQGQSASGLISKRIADLGDWRGRTLSRMRKRITAAVPDVVEEWKWMGTPVWSHDGIICTGESYKTVVKLTFAKGASLKDPAGLFNSSLDGNVRRAIDISEGEDIDESAFKTLVRQAAALNSAGKAKKAAASKKTRGTSMRAMAVAVLCVTAIGVTSADQVTPSAESRKLDAVIDAIVTRPARGTAAVRPDPAALLARLRAIDPKPLSFDEQIDRRFAETILVGRTVSAPAGQLMGEPAYTRMLKEQALLPYDAAALWTYAWKEFDSTVAALDALARTIDPKKPWLEIANDVKADHPPALKMIEAHQEIVDRARAHILAKDLMTLPWKETCTVVRRVPTAGNNPYYGSFSGATARPPADDGALRGEWQINPFDPAWDAQKQHDYLVEHDWGVILVTAPHETYGGHHVQIMYQMKNPRPLRQSQSTSMFTEGWGLYNEQLFKETGFFPDPKIQLRQLQLRLWRNARVIYDVGMQTSRMTRAEAITLMTDRVGFLRWAAESEVDSALARPGYFIGYFMGMSEILKMRDEYRRARGSAFTLKDFHDRLLRIGSMPPALMRVVLMHDVK